MKKRLEIIMSIVLLTAALFLARKGAETVLSTQLEKKEICICIDAGHGGADPGKVGVHGELEKDINLQLAYKVKALLEQQGIRVVMLRETDTDLADADAQNRKGSDLKKRVEMIVRSKADMAVSIHQNSYPDASVMGAQTFFYSESAEGEQLATCIQNSLIKRIDSSNTRQAKAYDGYYMLKKTPIPTVIVECGFLSNYQEAERLTDDQYQERLAFAVVMGIVDYINQ